MNEDTLNNLRDALLHRELTPQEKQSLALWLAAHPEAAETWREDAALSRALRQLPDAPVPSNFTSRVLDQVRLETRASARDWQRRQREGRWRDWLRPSAWIPAASVATAVVLAVAAWDWNTRQKEAQFARDVSPLRAMAALPPELLEDFDAIQRFGESSPPVDFELLAALE